MEECFRHYAIVFIGMKRDTEKEFLSMLCCAREHSHPWPGQGASSFGKFREIHFCETQGKIN